MSGFLSKFLEKIGFQSNKKETAKIPEKNKPADYDIPDAAQVHRKKKVTEKISEKSKPTSDIQKTVPVKEPVQCIERQVRRRPVIRLFVSSTFTDLKHERDALQRDVFSKLEQLCASRQFQFQAIDLRWGVPTEASLDHRTMRICFEELRRSQEISPQPNFLILLGNRYGWRPLPEEVSENEFHKLEQAAVLDAEREILKRWYCEDKNNIPPVFVLQSRKAMHEIGKDFTQKLDWDKVQIVLWEIINRAFPPAGLIGRFANLATLDDSFPSIVRFQASATEQEIWHGALIAQNASQHVLTFVREIENVEDFPRAADIKDFVDVDESGAINAISQGALGELKTELHKRLGENNVIGIEHARLTSSINEKGEQGIDVTTGHLAELCTRVHTSLEAIILRQINDYWGTSDPTVVSPRELELERNEHQLFGQERAPAKMFIGRKEQLHAISAYLNNDSRQPLVIHGASGCGKTALLARAAQDVTSERKPIIRFIGVTPRSSDIRSLLINLCQELRQWHPLESQLPIDLRELTQELHEHFNATTAQEPLILFLDALDQLDDADNGPSLNWIPLGPLHSHVKLIVSCLSDRASEEPAGQPYAALKSRILGEENFINLDALPEDEAKTLLFERWLPQANRKLNAAQAQCIRELLTSASCRQPLYLKVLFEEARLWRSDDTTPRPGDNVYKLLDALFNRLGNPANHGPTIEFVLGYIASARRGLTEMEILEVLYRDPEYRQFLEQMAARTGHRSPDNPKRIPIAIWSRFRFDLAPYLAEHKAPGGTVLNFYHRQVAEYVRGKFLDTPQKRQKRHGRLSDYFEHQEQCRRKDDELPWQLAEAQCWERLRDYLSDLEVLLRLHADGRKFEVMAYWRKMAERYDMATEYARAAQSYEKSGAPAKALAEHIGAAADLLWTGAEHRGAEPLLRRALEAEMAVADPRDSRVATRLMNLANLLHATNRSLEAEKLLREAIIIQEAVFGYSSPQITRALCQLANCLIRLERWDEAETLLRRALAIDEQAHGPNHPHIALDLAPLADIAMARGDRMQAESMYRRALSIEENESGPDDPNVAVLLNNLGVILTEMGRIAEAERMLRRALEIDEKAFGPNHPDTGRDIGNLTLLLKLEGRSEEAEALLRRVLQIDEHVYGPDHPDVAVDLHNLASHLFRHDRHAEAEVLWCRAIVIMVATHGEDHPRTRQMKTALKEMKAQQIGTEQERRAKAIDSQLRLARGLQMMGRLGEAMATFRQLERMYSAASDWAGVQNSVGFQSEVLCAMGDLEDALAMDKKREQLCRDHNHIVGLIFSLVNQAQLLAGQLDRPNEALPLAEESSRLAMQHGLNDLAKQAKAVMNFVRSKLNHR